jgi:hypothetical protein
MKKQHKNIDYYSRYLRMAKKMTENLLGTKWHYLSFVRIKMRSASSIVSGSDRSLSVECLCKCGGVIVTRLGSLKSGNTKSCGCLQKEIASTSGKNRKTHGATSDKDSALYRTHKIWMGMRDRCNPLGKHGRHRNYSLRGIKVCVEWGSFDIFLKDMGKAPVGMSLGRIDNNAGYSRKNCRWETRIQQSNNTRINKVLTYKGFTDTLANLCRIMCSNYALTQGRLARKWPVERAFEEPVNRKKPKSQ